MWKVNRFILEVGFQPFGEIPHRFLKKQVARSSLETDTNFHLKCHLCRDFLIFHLQIESKFLWVLRNSGRYGYDNYYTVKLGGNPHTIQLF
jgi:hypothetical protein